MVSAQSSPHASTLPRWSTVPTAAASSKLRDSCHACATSKVKCSKEKPTCSRCAKRGTSCEYLITKPPGRKHKNRTSERNSERNSATAIGIPTPASNSTIPPWPTVTASPTAPTAPSPPSGSESLGSRSSFLVQPSLFSVPSMPSMPSIPSTLGSEFDDLFASPISFPMPDAPDLDILTQPRIFPNAGSTSSKGSSVSRNEDSSESDIIYLFGHLPPSPPPPPPASSITAQFQLQADGMHNHQEESHSFGSQRCCFLRALDIMKRLFSGDPTRCVLSGEQPYESTRSHLSPAIQAVMSRNAHTIDDISSMLQCPCSKNSFLLALFLLIVGNVLSRYTAAARTAATDEEADLNGNSPASPCSSHHPEHMLQQQQRPFALRSENCSVEADSERMSAQLVLGELHRVQRFLNQLSPKIQACRREGKLEGVAGNNLNSLSDGENISSARPFSAAALEQLESELRKGVRALSLGIIDFLRRD